MRLAPTPDHEPLRSNRLPAVGCDLPSADRCDFSRELNENKGRPPGSRPCLRGATFWCPPVAARTKKNPGGGSGPPAHNAVVLTQGPLAIACDRFFHRHPNSSPRRRINPHVAPSVTRKFFDPGAGALPEGTSLTKVMERWTSRLPRPPDIFRGLLQSRASDVADATLPAEIT